MRRPGQRLRGWQGRSQLQWCRIRRIRRSPALSRLGRAPAPSHSWQAAPRLPPPPLQQHQTQPAARRIRARRRRSSAALSGSWRRQPLQLPLALAARQRKVCCITVAVCAPAVQPTWCRPKQRGCQPYIFLTGLLMWLCRHAGALAGCAAGQPARLNVSQGRWPPRQRNPGRRCWRRSCSRGQPPGRPQRHACGRGARRQQRGTSGP